MERLDFTPNQLIKLLGEKVTVIEDILEKKQIVNEFQENIEVKVYGINWDKILGRKIINIELIKKELDNQKCYIMWDEYHLPVMKTDLYNVIDNIDEIIKVAFDTWIFDLNIKWLIEHHHEEGYRFGKI